MSALGYIFWNANPEIFSVGPLHIRWYGLLFALGFLIGQQLIYRIYKKEGRDLKHVDPLTIYMVIATVVGARLGHCLFYDPYYYFIENPLEIFMIMKGGLASHGAAFLILFAAWRFHKKYRTNYLWVLDRIVIVIALAGCFIRFGNLMNSEIIGKPTNSSFGFVFAQNVTKYPYVYEADGLESISVASRDTDTIIDGQKYIGARLDLEFKKSKSEIDKLSFLHDTYPSRVHAINSKPDFIHDRYLAPIQPNDINQSSINIWLLPRHPAQLYESLTSLIAFMILGLIYLKSKGNVPEGRLFGLFCVIVFTLRFLYEFLKENQSSFAASFDQGPLINMGQILSIPLILIGIYALYRSFKKGKETTPQD